MLQSDYWAPADRLKVAIYDRVPGTDHFVKWSGDMQHYGVHPQATGVAGSGVLHGACREMLLSAVLAL